MISRNLLLSLALLPALLAVAWGQPGGFATPPPLRQSSLASELGWVRFGVSAGRVRVSNPQFRQNRVTETANPLVGSREVFRLQFDSPSFSVDYLLETAEHRLNVTFDTPQTMQLERLVKQGDELLPVRLVQPREGPLELTIGDGDSQSRYQGRTMWHLLLGLPPESRAQILPILESLRPNWQLADTADQIETSLLRVARAGQLPDRQLWQQWAKQLGSPLFVERRAAERQLRQAGPAIVPFLASLDRDRLDTESRLRIEQMLQSLSSNIDDTPDRIATWLVDDIPVWLTLLESEQLARRQAAKVHLARLLPYQIDFDPAGEVQQRQQQLEALRKKSGF